MIRIITTTYVPAVRWKGAERLALRSLPLSTRRRIVPLIELVPKDFLPFAASGRISKFAKALAETCRWGSDCALLLDPHLLGDDQAAVLMPSIAAAATRYEITYGIVTGVARSVTYQTAVREAADNLGCDICLRINPFEFRQAGFEAVIESALSRLGRTAKDIHLILDFQAVAADGINFAPWINRIPLLEVWPSITFLSGAFPKDLAHLARNEQHVLRRGDWESWCDLLNRDPTRLPTFGDYTIQHGIFEEHEGKHFNFSASIRYTSPAGWVVMRGEGVLNEDGPGYAQWPANAQLLCERPEFCGPSYCWGDTFMKDMSAQLARTGSAKEWLAAGINHHITMVVNHLVEVQVQLVRAAAPAS
jgi:Beta protein